MNKQDKDIVQINYRIGDLVMDYYGEIAKIVDITKDGYDINYVGSKYDDGVTTEYLLGNYVPCAFQIGDKITYNYEKFTIVDIMRSDINHKYYYELRGENTACYELVKYIYSSGQFTESQVLAKIN